MEHVLNIYSVVNYAINCINHQNPIEFLMIVQLKELFEVTSYSPLKAFFGKILNLVATFSWTYMDLFVILMSIGISSKFKQFNSNLELIKGEVGFVQLFLTFLVLIEVDSVDSFLCSTCPMITGNGVALNIRSWQIYAKRLTELYHILR